MWLSLAVSACIVGLICWNDRIHPCLDGDRYTSGKAQPYPFHRRFCGWNTRTLQICSLVSIVGLGVGMGSWQKAALLLTLPGAWFIATHPTTVDAPAMLLACGCSLIWPSHPFLAIALSACSGFLHERGPVFAALYSWSPWPLLGLAAVGWWREAEVPDGDRLVGRGLVFSVFAHRKYVDFLDSKVNLGMLRGVLPMAAYYGASPAAWSTLAVAWMSRLVGSDGARFVFWAAPALIRDLPEVPVWMILAHVVTFRRMA